MIAATFHRNFLPEKKKKGGRGAIGRNQAHDLKMRHVPVQTKKQLFQLSLHLLTVVSGKLLLTEYTFHCSHGTNLERFWNLHLLWQSLLRWSLVIKIFHKLKKFLHCELLS